jgi:hypothetical protein
MQMSQHIHPIYFHGIIDTHAMQSGWSYRPLDEKKPSQEQIKN